MNLLILDTETTGLSPSEGHKVIEIGAILFSVDDREVIAQCSFLLPCLKNDARFINHISSQLTRRAPELQEPMGAAFWSLVASADFAVAHNAAFDKKWLGEGGCLPSMPLPWICSMDDIQWPMNSKRGRPSVVSLALDYGIPVWQAHRALTDCIYLAEVMKREPRLEQLISDALQPRHIYVSTLSYDQRQHCKDAGFTWNNLVPKMWAKKMTMREADAIGFPVSLVE